MVGASSVVSACIAAMALLIERPALRIHAEGSPTQEEKKTQMIVLGVVLLVVGFVTESPCW
jgi:primosomal replication protein N